MPPPHKRFFKKKWGRRVKERPALAREHGHLWSVPYSLRLPSDREPEFEAHGELKVMGSELNCPKHISNSLVDLHAGPDLTPQLCRNANGRPRVSLGGRSWGRTCDLLDIGGSLLQGGCSDLPGGFKTSPTLFWT